MAQIWYFTAGNPRPGKSRAKVSIQWCVDNLGLVLGDDPIPLADWEKLKCDQQPNDNGPSRCVFVEVNDDNSVGLNQRGFYWLVGKQPEQVDRLLERL